MIFDVQPGSLNRKARYVSGGHMTKAPSTITYASVVSREFIRIGLPKSVLNDLEVFAADIKNGKTFGPHRKGMKAILVRGLCGL
jgi:hypothetical protein